MSKATVVEIRTQNVGITTIGVEMVGVPTMDVVRRGILFGFATKLGSESGEVLIGKKLNGSLALPITTIGVIRTL
jgi:hypothetical protein